MSFFEFSGFSEASAPPARASSRPATRSNTPPRTSPPPSGATTRPASGTSASANRGPSAGRTPAGTRPSGAARPATQSSSSSANRPDSRSGGGFSFDRFAPFLQQGWDFVAPQLSRFVGPQSGPQQGPGPAPGALTDPGGAAPFAQPSPADAGAPPFAGAPQQFAGAPQQPQQYWQPPPSADRLGLLMQALQQRQIPPLPAPAVTAPQADGLGLLRLILSNPQFQQSLQQAAMTGAGAVAPVALPMPAAQAPGHLRSMDIPLGAVINAIAGLTGPALMQLNARTSEADPEVPEYLVSEDGEFIVDPASSDDRASLVVHMFEVSDEAQRLALQHQRPLSQSSPRRAYTELDEADEWARDVGLL